MNANASVAAPTGHLVGAATLALASSIAAACGARATRTATRSSRPSRAADKDGAIDDLREWIALPTIANMNVNAPKGAAYMRQLALDAGFQKARIVKPMACQRCSPRSTPARMTLDIYFMYDVKHYDPPMDASRPSKGGWLTGPGGRGHVGRGACQPERARNRLPAAVRAFKTGGVKLPVTRPSRRRRRGNRLDQLSRRCWPTRRRCGAR